MKHRALLLLNPDIQCVVEKDRYIYDKDMPHLSYEVDEVKVGDIMKGMVVEFADGKLYLTLQNSKIQGCKMQPIEMKEMEDFNMFERRVFHKLGIATQKAGVLKNSGKFLTLELLLNQAGLN